MPNLETVWYRGLKEKNLKKQQKSDWVSHPGHRIYYLDSPSKFHVNCSLKTLLTTGWLLLSYVATYLNFFEPGKGKPSLGENNINFNLYGILYSMSSTKENTLYQEAWNVTNEKYVNRRLTEDPDVRIRKKGALK